MSFPNKIFGDYGDEKVTSSAKIGSLPLGTIMELPDGRLFRHAKAGTATDLVAGRIVSTTAGVAAHGNVAASGLVASATATHNALGAETIKVVAGSVAMTKDMWADGFMNVQDDTGEGRVYKVRANDSAAASALVNINLEYGDGLNLAFANGSTTVSLRKSPYEDAIVYSAGTIIAPPMGVAPVAVTKAYYFWVQRRGPASIPTSATTVTDGQQVIASTATAGSCTVAIVAQTSGTNLLAETNRLGFAMETVSATECALVDLRLE